MGQGQIGGDHPRFQTWAQKRVQDNLAYAADLAQTRQKQQGRLQHLAIHHRMGAGAVAQIPDLRRNHRAQNGKAQIGAHGLRHADPIIARGALHRFIALIDDHADGLIMGGRNGLAQGIMRIPRPFGAVRQPNSIKAQIIAGRFQIVGDLGGVVGRGRAGHGPVLQQDKRAQGTPLRQGGGLFAHIPPACRAFLQFAPHIAKLGAGEHIGAFGHPRHIGCIDIGGGVIHALEGFKRVRAHRKGAFGVRVGAVACLGTARQPQLPARAMQPKPRLCGHGRQRLVAGQLHGGCHHRQPIVLPQPRRLQVVVYQPRRHRQARHHHIAGSAGMRAGLKAQHAQIFGQDNRGFRAAQTGALAGAIGNPVIARLALFGGARVGIKQHQGMAVGINGRGRRAKLFAQLGHGLIYACGKRFCLFGAQTLHQRPDIGVFQRLVAQGICWQLANARHIGIAKIGKRFQMLGAFQWAVWNGGAGGVCSPAAQDIQHGLCLGHGIDQAMGRLGLAKGHRGFRANRLQRGHRPAAQLFARVGACMQGPVFRRKKPCHIGPYRLWPRALGPSR